MKSVSTALAVIAAASMLTLFTIGLWFAIAALGFPWWIAVGPAVVFGLVGVGIASKVLHAK